MKITKKSLYAIRALIALARHESSTSLTIAQIAEAQQLPRKFLEQILLALKSEGLLISRAGPRGGYTLARTPASITLAEIFSAVEEPISVERRNPRAITSGPDDPGKIRQLLTEVRTLLQKRLNEITLLDLAQEDELDQHMETLMYYI